MKRLFFKMGIAEKVLEDLKKEASELEKQGYIPVSKLNTRIVNEKENRIAIWQEFEKSGD